MTLEAIDPNKLTELLETILFYENIHDHRKGHSMKYLIGSGILLHVIL